MLRLTLSNARGCNAGGDSFFNAASMASCAAAGPTSCVGAKGGNAGSTTTQVLGGSAASSVGTVKFSGDNGFFGKTDGAGGAAGPNGAGGNGTATLSGSGDNGTTAGVSGSVVGTNGTEWDASHGSGSGGARTSSFVLVNRRLCR